MQKKWEDYTHEERLESFAKYAKFQITNAIRENLKVWETKNEENQTLRPFNAVSGSFYNGLNSILLEVEAKRKNYQNGAWITQQQAKMMGVKIKEGEQGVKIAYIKQSETRIKKDENGNPLTEPQIDKEGNVKINPKTGEPYWRYVTEKVKLDNPILETAYLYHQSQCDLDLSRVVMPNLTNNALEIKEPIISDKIGLYPQTKQEICNYLDSQQVGFLKSQGVEVMRNQNENGKIIGESLLIDGKLNGVQKTWHDNGKLKSVVNCVDDKYDGIKKIYFENGKLQSETHFKMDKKGIHKEFDENGRFVKEIDFNKVQKRVSPQVRADQERKAQTQQQGRGR